MILEKRQARYQDQHVRYLRDQLHNIITVHYSSERKIEFFERKYGMALPTFLDALEGKRDLLPDDAARFEFVLLQWTRQQHEMPMVFWRPKKKQPHIINDAKSKHKNVAIHMIITRTTEGVLYSPLERVLGGGHEEDFEALTPAPPLSPVDYHDDFKLPKNRCYLVLDTNQCVAAGKQRGEQPLPLDPNWPGVLYELLHEKLNQGGEDIVVSWRQH